MISDEALERALDFIRDKANDIAIARSEVVYLTEYRKSLKSILMREAEANGVTRSASQERDAYSDQRYLDHLKALKIATETYERLRFQMKGAELKVDLWRTRSANERSERQRYGA